MSKRKKNIRTVLLILVILLAAIQFYRPRINKQLAVAAPSGIPDSVLHFLQKACYDCHSDSTSLSWFDKPAPVYWLVRRHVLQGKAVLNFSRWDSMSPADRKGKLFESLNQIEYNTMPLSDYLLLHHAASPTAQDIAALKNYLSTFDIAAKPAAVNKTAVLAASTAADPTTAITSPLPAPGTIAPEWNGFEFIKDYKDWTPISASERFDNGTAFAKIAWKQASDTNGRIHPGDFIQVELMLRDSKKYASSYNWGWGRWRGPNLTPYGKNASFVGECMRCHLPMKSNDFVFTIPLNTTPSDAKFKDVLQWKGVATFIDPRQKTMSILYTHDTASALATWPQRDDPHWYGARIPAAEAPTVKWVHP